MSLNKFKNLAVNSDAKSSRFVIDLKQDLAVAEINEAKNKNNQIVESKLEKLAELDYKKYFGESKVKAKAMAANFKNSLFKIKAPALASSSKRTAKKASRVDKNERASLLDQLAFVALIKLVYKICYCVGWLIIFILRFIHLALKAIIKPVIKILNFVYNKFYKANLKLFNYSAFFKKSSAFMRLIPKVKEGNMTPLTPLLKGGEYPFPARTADVVQSGGYQGGAIGIGYLKPVLVFAGVLLIIVLPVKAYTYYKTIDSAKGRVLGESESAIGNLISGGRSAANLDFSQADKSFAMAGDNFLAAQNQLAEINGLLFTLASAVPNKTMQLAAASKHILKAGELSAAAGKNLSLATAGLLNFQTGDTSDILSDLSAYGRKAVVNLTELTGELDQINSDLVPENYRQQFILLKQKTAEFKRGLNEFIGLADSLDNFLGGNTTKRYLLIFQNNSELRASGGFIGSFALMDIAKGKIKNIEVPGGGSYDTDAGLLKKIKSPEPLSLVRPDWHFWDANWWPDWPTSAKKLAWFYENSDGSTVDGVISFTPTVMEKILRVIGPIDLKEKYGLVIDADNFWLETQKLSEQKPDVTKQPKKIIGDLMNKIIEELPKRLNKDNIIGLLKAFEESLNDKNVLFYFADHELEAKVQDLGWDGSLKETSGDYLSVINTNIAGGKSDRTIKQEITHQAEIQADGTIVDNLTIKRTHQAIKRQPFTGVRNVDWLRIYVPLGSKLISADGFRPVDKIFFKQAEAGWQNDPDIEREESSATVDQASATKIYTELGKTVFANWSQVDPGESIEINIKYQLPFKLTDKQAESDQGFVNRIITQAGAVINPEQKNLYSYSLLAQKQPGMNSSTIVSELNLNDNFKPIWKFPENLNQGRNGWQRSENFEQDELTAVMVEGK